MLFGRRSNQSEHGDCDPGLGGLRQSILTNLKRNQEWSSALGVVGSFARLVVTTVLFESKTCLGIPRHDILIDHLPE